MPNPNRQVDPYVYPGTDILINKFDIQDDDQLQIVEGVIFAQKHTEILPTGNFDYDHLKAIHKHYFDDLYEWAGEQRTVNIAKGNDYFAHTAYIKTALEKIFNKLKDENHLQDTRYEVFCKRLSYYFNEINAVHPFREGNGRTQRAFCNLLAEKAGYSLDWTLANQDEYIKASIEGFNGSYEAMENIFRKITTKLERSLTLNTVDAQVIISHLKHYVEKQI